MKRDERPRSTMRIDISPELLAQIRAGKVFGLGTGHEEERKAEREVTSIGDQDFQELLQNIYDGVLITDFDGNILNANVRVTQFFRCEAKDLCRSHIFDVFFGADEALLSTIRDTLQSDRFMLIQVYCLLKDGSFFPAEVSVNRLRVSSREYLAFFIRDITLRKETEDRLRTGHRAIQIAGSGMAIADVEGRLSYCNPALLSLWGFGRFGDVEGMDVCALFVDAAKAVEMMEAVARGEGWDAELEMKKSDGTTFFVRATVAPDVNDEDELAGMVLSFLDITGRKRAERQLAAYASELSDKNEQLEDDLGMAREVQQALMPHEDPVFPHNASVGDGALNFSYLYYPSTIIGGDFFNILTVSDTVVGVLVADVMGHGMRAALVVATLRGLIEKLSGVASDPGAFLTQLNRAYTDIFQRTSGLIFSTAFYMNIDITSGRMTYSSAGHPPPFVMHRPDGEVTRLPFTNSAQGPAVGLFEDATYHANEYLLSLHDMVILYTDGLTEIANADGEEYEAERVGQSLRRHVAVDPPKLLKALIEDAQAYSGSTVFDDDVCLLGIEVARVVGAKDAGG